MRQLPALAPAGGGLGQRGVLRNVSDQPMHVYLSTERVKHPCFGVVGGSAGAPGAVRCNGEAVFPKGKLTLQPGDRLELEPPGGGGWGNPLARPRELVESDLRQGLVTPAHARDVYGWKGS